MKHMASNARFGSRTMLRAVAVPIIVGYAVVAAATTQISPDRTITMVGSYADAGYVVFTPALRPGRHNHVSDLL